jgi:hypothetical protein
MLGTDYPEHLLAREPPPPYDGEGAFALWHFSEDPSLGRFRPHTPATNPEAIHAITDSAPAPRIPAVIQALESRHNDPDAGIRRRVRKTLAHYRRTGKVTDAAH